MNPRARTRTTAWLGLIAMWLIVLAPLVSQLVDAWRKHQPVAALCSTTLDAGVSQHGSPAGALNACGYCDLLTTHVSMPPGPAVLLPILTLVALASVSTLSTSFTPLGAFPSGRPRAPPALR
ncbi:DUF2946 domain-containing protein [Paraburkholderia oxyphila]|uniref:DUF2946 domain-containing protein n=1 Tax=Paraburkholderia oxyphila TaxID=614212 RepID=UPI000481E3F3|nr:DUF2946 domain-containing protein [Paraburkholderia oxyphila]